MADPFSIALGGITICQVAAKIIQLGIGYGQSVKNLPADVKELISEISLLSGVLNSLCSFFQNEGSSGTFSLDLLQQTIAECNDQLEELHSYLVKHQGSGSRLKNLGRALKWPLREQDTRDWITRMERYKNTISLALEQEKLALSRNLSKDVAAMKIAQETDRIEKEMVKRIETFRVALEWLSPADPRENHLAARKLQQRGTGKWFTESKEFENWRFTESSILWLYGTAGTGKTILFSIILDHLMAAELDTPSPVKTIYFYCDFKDSKKVNTISIYGSLLAQLLQPDRDNDLPEDFKKYYEKNHSRPPGEEFIKEQLMESIRKAGRTRILVDALDECIPSAQTAVLEALMEIHQAGQVNLLITSRPGSDIKFLLQEVPKICIDAAVSSQDIQLFVKEECERNVKLKRKLKGSTKLEVISTITVGANGMFLWAKCSLDEISRLRNDKEIKQALRRLPRDLKGTYERIIKDISNDDKDLAIRILQWLACSLRPMTIPELIEGVALELGDTSLDPEAFLNDPEDISEICGSLITLNQGTGAVGLAHFSVKEFLISHELRQGPHSDFFIDPVQTNFELAKLCVTYLCFDHFSIGPCATGEELEGRCDTYALYPYAASKWPEHAKAHTSMDDKPFLSVIERFFLDEDMNGNFDSWTQVFEALLWKYQENNLRTGSESYLERDRGENRLIYACRLGLFSTAKLLLSSGIDPQLVCTSKYKDEAAAFPRTRACGNALNAACESGDFKTVELILSAGANVNAIAGSDGLAIIIAIRKCHLADRNDFRVVEYLLEKGADPNLITPSGRWALSTAEGHGCCEAVKLCLDAGADISIRNNMGGTMFEWAAIFSHEDVFELLRQHGGGKHISPDLAELNLNPDVDGYSLFLASKSNFFESAQKILEKDGAKIFGDPSYEFLMYNTFLECALHGYYKFVEQMLVYSGSSFSAFDDFLKVAASQGHAKTLGAFLNANPNFDRNSLGSLRVLAAGRHHLAVIAELDKHGVPSTCSEHGWDVGISEALTQNTIQEQNLALLQYREKGLAHAFKIPTSWRRRTDLAATTTPVVEIEGAKVYLPPGEAECWITFDHPISPDDLPYYYFEITIEETGGQGMKIGIASALTEYDGPDVSPILYTGSGEIQSPSSRSHGFPSYQKGSVIGCAVDLMKRIAVFTCDGKVVDASCSDVRGMVYGIAFMHPGDQIKANFGDEPFIFDTSVFSEVKGLEVFVKEPTFIFRTKQWKDPLEMDIANPNPNFVG